MESLCAEVVWRSTLTRHQRHKVDDDFSEECQATTTYSSLGGRAISPQTTSTLVALPLGAHMADLGDDDPGKTAIKMHQTNGGDLLDDPKSSEGAPAKDTHHFLGLGYDSFGLIARNSGPISFPPPS